MTDAIGRILVTGVLRRGDFGVTLDFVIEPGETVGLWGGIGAGKSSVLTLLTGDYALETGRIEQPNRPVAKLAQRYTADLAEDRTGVENALDRAAPEVTESEVRTLLSDLGVGAHVVDRLPWTFSGAEAQRIALTTAICSRAPLILLDEPFSALDKRTGHVVRTVLADWCTRSPSTVVVAGTNADHLGEVCDRVIELATV